jgi:putative glycosyltransferase (TIGR04372 family)
VPGGGAALAPARWCVHVAQYCLSWFTPHAKMPRLFRRAHQLYHRHEFAAAAGVYSELLAIDPEHRDSLVRRAEAYLMLERYRDAVADCRAAVALPAVAPSYRVHAYSLMSQAYTLAGEIDAGVAIGQLARLLGQDGEDAAWDRDPPPPGPDEYERLANLHNDLAELVINTRADFGTAAQLYRRGDAVRREYARWLEHAPADTLFLSEDWVRNIGHMALVDFWVKMRRMGWHSCDRVLLLAPTRSTANRNYAEYYRPFMTVHTSNAIHHGLRHLVNTFGPRVASLLPLPDGTTRYFTEGMGLIQQAWEDGGGGPLLTLTGKDAAFGRRELRKLGVPAGAWFVSLHARSPGFHREGRLTHQAHRNADIETYLPAIQEVVRRGGWVVRLGDKTMPPLPKMRGVVDYARSPHKSPQMDVFLCAACRFFVGVASGISHVPTTFGVPCVLTNWLSNALPVYSGMDLFVPKLLRSKETRRLLTFDEYLSPETRLLCYSGQKLEDHELEVVDNSPDELRAVVAEMMDQLDEGVPSGMSPRTAAFDALARGHGLAGFSRISRAFVDKHAAILPREHSFAKAA